MRGYKRKNSNSYRFEIWPVLAKKNRAQNQINWPKWHLFCVVLVNCTTEIFFLHTVGTVNKRSVLEFQLDHLCSSAHLGQQ